MLESVMLIDDNKHDNLLHEMAIYDTGLAKSVVKYLSGEKALEFLTEATANEGRVPPLILLDINMPGMSGWDFLEEYQKLPVHLQKRSFIVMLTTSYNPNDLERAKKEPVLKGFLNKPLTEEMFDEIVKTHFVPLHNAEPGAVA
jgi:CheY-like chemotaxis protein